ncbi:MAG: prephenate dehydratase domain-containing protein [Pyrinomonadaceae bacterium]
MNPTVTNPKLRVAFQGERGAFSEEAALRLLGEEIELVPRQTFEALYESVREKAADRILAPIENSLAGSIHRSYDLLLDCNLTITGETIIPVVHNLIGRPGAAFDEISKSFARIRSRWRNARSSSPRTRTSSASPRRIQPAACAK